MSIEIRPARDVAEPALAQFYREAFPHRAHADVWRWLYRTGWENHPLPLVMLDGSRVIAHAGGIPFRARLGGQELSAQWFVDFALLHEYRRQGLGTRLTEHWASLADICVTFCNDDSWRVFQRLGWLTSAEPVLHTLWLRAGDHPRMQRMPGPARAVAGAAVSAVMGLARSGTSSAEPRPLDPEGLASLVGHGAGGDSDAVVTAVRDPEYLQWRIERSPARARYRIFDDDEATMLVSVGDSDRLDVLWMTPREGASMRGSLAALARWAAGYGYSAIRYLPESPAIASSVAALLPVVSRPRYACWSTDSSLRALLANAGCRWQLIDSDFEWI